MIVPLLLLLALLIVCDWRKRCVYIWQLLLFALAQMGFCLTTLGSDTTLSHLIESGTIFLLLATCIGLYLFFRFRGKRQAIGWGDVWFVALLTPYFTATSFLRFLIIALLLTLAGWSLLYLRRRRPSEDIPLVSTVGICYATLLCYHLIAGR